MKNFVVPLHFIQMILSPIEITIPDCDTRTTTSDDLRKFKSPESLSIYNIYKISNTFIPPTKLLIQSEFATVARF